MLKNKKGFTLLELLVVVLIIGILGAIALPQYMVSVERSRVVANASLLKPLYDAALQYYSFNDEFPDSLKKLPVTVPESYSISGLTATKDDGTCKITLDSGAKSINMQCGRGTSPEYKIEFKYTVNDSGSIFGSGQYFSVIASGDRAATYNKVAQSSGWTKNGNAYLMK